MMTVIEANTLPIIIALLIGFVIGWWMFRLRRKAPAERLDLTARSNPAPLRPQQPAPTARLDSSDTPEGNTIVDQGAAATTDVAGQILGVQVHEELPGASGPPDNLQLLKGVGPKLAATLNARGLTRFEQIARLTPNEVAILDQELGAFSGRLTRDRIVEQARYLERNDTEGFEAMFGKLGNT
jgi:predicted flap endonuclease-1-like 5' DNA nuclease